MKRPNTQVLDEDLGNCIKRMKLCRVADDIQTRISTESHLLGVAYAKQRTLCSRRNADLRVALLLGLTIEETERQMSLYSRKLTEKEERRESVMDTSPMKNSINNESDPFGLDEFFSKLKTARTTSDGPSLWTKPYEVFSNIFRCVHRTCLVAGPQHRKQAGPDK